MSPGEEQSTQIAVNEKPSSCSLQSTSDPDVTYGHRGKGYQVRLAETCAPDNPFQVITAADVNGANDSDQHQVTPTLEQTERFGALNMIAQLVAQRVLDA
jgi:hypothetical protein